MNDNQFSRLDDGTEPAALSNIGGLELPASYRPAINLAPEERDFLLTPAFVVKAIWRWWLIALSLALLLAAGSGATIWWLFVPVYRAVAWVQITNRTPFLAYERMESPDRAEQFVKTQIELLRSKLVLDQVSQRPTIVGLREVREQDNPVAWMRERIRVEVVGNSDLYQVSFDGPNPTNSAMLINAIVDEYFNRRADADDSQTQRVIDLLELEKNRRQTIVHELRERMRKLSKDLLGRDPFTGTPAGNGARDGRPLETLSDRLATAEIESKVLEAQIKAAEEALHVQRQAVPEVLVEAAIEELPEINELKVRLGQKVALLQQVETTAAKGKNDPAYQRLADEIARLEKTLADAESAARPKLRGKMQVLARLDREDKLVEMKSKLEISRTAEVMFRDRYQKQMEQLGQSGDQSLDLEFTRSELAREEKVFDTISQRVTELRTEQRAPARITLLEPAVTPESPVQRLPTRELALAVLASLLMPFALAVGWERMVRRVSEIQQLERQSAAPLIVEVAKLPRRRLSQSRLIGHDRPIPSLFEESIDNLRTCLLLAEARRAVQTIAITSAVESEGKTSVSLQLAASLARATGQPTLLVDGDMRSPDLHRMLEVASEPGLTKLLDGACDLDETIIEVWGDKLHFLPAGRLHKSPHKLLGNGAFPELLRQLKKRYHHIVIDTPPVLSASEALVLARAADGAIVCAMRDSSRESQVRLAFERLNLAGVCVLGAALNGVSVRSYAARYGSYTYARRES